jgi:5'-methylthioadenosine phosphorylase
MSDILSIELGVIGGSGIYGIPEITIIDQKELQTSFGSPSSVVTIGDLEGLKVGFIARHGIDHTLTPTEVNYRANILALKTLGARKILGISACGSLREDYIPGDLVIANQLIDQTRQRPSSFFGGGIVAHIGVAQPFCPEFSAQVFEAMTDAGVPAKFGGTAITIEGPRFSTRAESQLYRSWGIDLIGMTTSPEAFLAREAELCYCAIFHVTDYDVWHQSEAPVSVGQVIEQLKSNVETTRQALTSIARHYSPSQSCECPTALQQAFATRPRAVPEALINSLDPLISKYYPKS